MQTIFTVTAFGLALATGSVVLPGNAEAHTRARSISVQGAHGRGLLRQDSVTHQPGYRSASRSIQINDGRGMTASRTASRGDGSYSGSIVRTHADGSTSSRTRTVTPD